ncbi:hypothetical protein Hanom_Chr13g01199631 [Helianthus anomalus]
MLVHKVKRTELPFKLIKKTARRKMDGVNEPDENGKISSLWIQMRKTTFGRKSQKWPNLMDKNSKMAFYSSFINLKFKHKSCASSLVIHYSKATSNLGDTQNVTYTQKLRNLKI